jgi:KUP system potassium uptake protein
MVRVSDLEGGGTHAARAFFLESWRSVRWVLSTATSARARSMPCEALHGAARDGTLGGREVIGIVSLLLWTLMLIVTLKYVVLMLRADSRGEGGTLSLLALAERAIGRRTRCSSP